MSKILVTGTAGFIGFWTARTLLERGHEVVGVDNFTDYYDVRLKRARAAQLGARCRIAEMDIADDVALKKLVKETRPDQICHLAAQAGVRYSLENPFAYERANGLGTLSILEACRQGPVPSLVYASSSSVYGGNTKVPFSVEDNVDRPISLYAATKKYNELMAYTYHHLFGMHTTGLRFFTVYGPWGRPDMALFKFTKAILENQPIDVYNHGKMKRGFTFVTDIVDGIVAALDRNYPYEIFNLGHPRTVDLLHYIECIENYLGKKAQKNFLPLQSGDVPEAFADIAYSTEKLGFSPRVSVEDGVAKFIDWYREYYKV